MISRLLLPFLLSPVLADQLCSFHGKRCLLMFSIGTLCNHALSILTKTLRIIDPRQGDKDKAENPWIHCSYGCLSNFLETGRQRRKKPYNWRFSLSSTVSAGTKIGFLLIWQNFYSPGRKYGTRSLWQVTLRNHHKLLIKLSNSIV